jgi:hypothetical protein
MRIVERKRTVIQTLVLMVFATGLFVGGHLLIRNINIWKTESARKILVQERTKLAQNKLNFVGLTRTRPGQQNAEELRKSVSARLAELEKPLKFPLYFGDVDRLGDKLETWRLKERDVLAVQKAILEETGPFSAAVYNIYMYVPESDLATEAAERSAKAVQGLETIFEKVSALKLPEDKTLAWRNQLRRTQDRLKEVAGGGRTESVTGAWKELINESYKLEMSYYSSSKAVQMLTDETNLLLEYDYWVTKLGSEIR